ncbi:MAG: sensor histidine kinase KdpD, partial [Chloroflexota bacterium]
RETIPDSILEQADEVEVIDISPDDLLKRLSEGKIYMPQQADQAMRNFFRKGNLMALRELSLRRTADRVDTQMQVYRQDKSVEQIWPAGEHILVCISPSPLSSRLVRAAKRMATGLRAEWVTVYVETPNTTNLSDTDRTRVIQTLRLAEQLGAETATLSGHNVVEELLNYSRKQNVTKIIVGKPVHSRWRDLLFGSVLDELVRKSGSIDVYVISGELDAPQASTNQVLRNPVNWKDYAQAVLVVAICTLISGVMFPYLSAPNLIMVYLVGTVLVAVRYGRSASVLTSILSVLAFDFFFVSPYFTFAVSDTEYLITFSVMLLVGMVISGLMVRTKGQAQAAREREQRTSSLYEMSREFANSSTTEKIVEVAIKHIEEIFESQVILMLPDETTQLKTYGSPAAMAKLSPQEEGVARWVYDHGQAAGLGTQTLPGSEGIHLPLMTSDGTIGGIGVYPKQSRRIFSPDQLHLLETFANQTALALERSQLSEKSEQAQVQIETERLRNSLLSSVSHDLRTPLAAITGAVSGLLQPSRNLDGQGHELAQIAFEEAERMNRLVSNLLEMTRLESGAVRVDKEWQPLEEVVGTTLTRLEKLLLGHTIRTNLPDDLPLVPIDGILIEQVLVNLLENAIKYTPVGTTIELNAQRGQDEVIVEVADHGPGLLAGDEKRIFDKFYRVRSTTVGGVGLGLTICRAIVEAHGGRIWALNRPAGGALFQFTIPLEGEPPQMNMEDEHSEA